MQYTAKQMIVAVAQTVNVRVESWIIPMLVMDVKTAYGVPRVKVEPVNGGSGSAWIDLSRIVADNGEKAVIKQY